MIRANAALARQPAQKYGNKKTVIDGITFDSKREATRYATLKTLQHTGEISGLERQVAFEIAPSVTLDGRKRPARKYVADFRYTLRSGQTVVEDVKGFATSEYRLKRHLVRALYGVEVVEV